MTEYQGDSGSSLGKFWFSIFCGNENRFNQSALTHFQTNFATRLTVGIMYALSLLPLLVIGTWFWGAILIVFGTMYFNVYMKQSSFKFLKTIYNTAEVFTGASVGLGAFLACL